jgi:hypothetical protein
MLTMTTRVVLYALLIGGTSGCSDGSKNIGDASGSAEAGVSSPDVTGEAAPSPDAPTPDPLPCVAIPTTCPPQQPSYARDIAPILAAKCNTCHSEEVDSGPWPLTEYSYVSDWQTNILADVQYCTMPPAGATPLTSTEQDAILAWIVCNAPDN